MDKKIGIAAKDRIPNDAIRKLAATLTAYDLQWATALANKMYPQSKADLIKDPENKRGRQRVYNIVSAQLKNNASKVAFLIRGKELLEEFKTSQQQAKGVAEEAMSEAL